MKLSKKFFSREPDKVARDLLGCKLIRKLDSERLVGRIVETEAYFGSEDPASRAYGKTKENAGMARKMFSRPGTIFVYMVHANWLFNVVSKVRGAGAVLIRALEPLEGLDFMFTARRKRNKKINKKKQLSSGPGKLTQSLEIKKKHSGLDITNNNKIWIEKGKVKNIERSRRIGVTKDLPQPLRFYIKGNRFVSK